MATLAQINARIQKVEPLVELVKGSGYHYFVFDTKDQASFTEETDVYETESVMVPYLKDQSASVWVDDALRFGRQVRAQYGLPSA